MTETYLDPRDLQKQNGTWVANVPGPALLAIVSDSCYHCHGLKKTLATMSKPPRTYFITSDRNDSETQNLLRQLEVSGVPDMYRVDATGRISKYDGPRDAGALSGNFGGSGGGQACNWERWILPFILVVIFVLAMTLSR